MKKHITLIDLNNFSYYPTMAVGLLARYIKAAGFDLETLIPLSQGISSRKREKVEGPIDYLITRLVQSDWWILRVLVKTLKQSNFIYQSWQGKRKIYKFIVSELNRNTDLILISCYTENYGLCQQICSFLKDLDIPVIIGGPGFNSTENTKQFLGLQGVKAVVGAEMDEHLGDLLKDYFDGGDITKYPGVSTPTHLGEPTKYVFKELDQIPVPDYTDFPWDKYPFKVIPYMAGRGCSWGKCNFCLDVKYVNGRTFRSHSSEKIMSDLTTLSQEVGTNIVNFTDIKLNSHVGVWNEIIDKLPTVIQDPVWFCSVHVDNRVNNGLDLETLKRAKAAGLTRISFGLETASQRLLDHMNKGTTVERLEQFVNDVYKAGISLRATMFVGYLTETHEDLRLTYEFLERNKHCFDRVRVSRFQIFEMAPIYQELDTQERSQILDNRFIAKNRDRAYYNYKTKILKTCYKINAKGLNEDAVKYDGVM